MWTDIKFETMGENLSSEDLLQFQMALNRKLSHVLSHIKDAQIIDISADKILNVESVFSQTIVTETLYADKGYIAELTVDQLDTSTKVAKYLANDTSDVNYIRVFEQNIEFIEAKTNGINGEQLTDRDGNLIYWIDESNKGVTLEETPYPVMIFIYTELVKQKFAFEEIDGLYTPVVQMGAGSGVGDNGKAFLYKGLDGLSIEYVKNDGNKNFINITEDGIEMSPNIIAFPNTSNGTSLNITNETTLDGLSVNAFSNTRASFNVLINATSSVPMNVTLTARVDAEVFQTTYKHFSGAYKDQIFMTGVLPVLAFGERTVDFVITVDTGTLTVDEGDYSLSLIVRQGVTTEAPPFPTANTFDNVESDVVSAIDDVVVVMSTPINVLELESVDYDDVVVEDETEVNIV